MPRKPKSSTEPAEVKGPQKRGRKPPLTPRERAERIVAALNKRIERVEKKLKPVTNRLSRIKEVLEMLRRDESLARKRLEFEQSIEPEDFLPGHSDPTRVEV